MCERGREGLAGDDIDPAASLWVRGVDYIGGWRDAAEAAPELADALAVIGVDLAGVKLRPDAGADGSGVVRLELPPKVAREIAKVLRASGTPWEEAG